MDFFPDEEGLTAKELADTFISQTLDFQTSLDEITTKIVLGFARTLARADELMRQCQMANEEYPSEMIVFTVLLKKGDALWGKLRPWLNDRRELLYLIDDMKIDSVPVVPIPIAWARELIKDTKTKDFGHKFELWIREVEEAFNDPNALMEICQIAPDNRAESGQAINVKAINVKATSAKTIAKKDKHSIQSQAEVKTAKAQSKDRSAQTKRWAKTMIVQDSDSEATTVFDDESETHSNVTSKRLGVSSPADDARGRYSQFLDEGMEGELQFMGGRTIRSRKDGVTRQPKVPTIRPMSRSSAGTVEGWVEDIAR